MMTDTDVGDGGLLSLGLAAKLTGVRRDALERRIRRGEIGVRILGKGKDAKLRLTAAALREAGLLPPAEPAAPAALPGTNGSDAAVDLAPLLAMIQEQGARIAALEDQRFRLAGELGAAIERARLVEERMRAVAESTVPSAPGTVTLLPHDDRPGRRRRRFADGRRASARSTRPATGEGRDGAEVGPPGAWGGAPTSRPATRKASATEIALLRAVDAGRLGPRQATKAIRLLTRAWRARRRPTLFGVTASGRDG